MSQTPSPAQKKQTSALFLLVAAWLGILVFCLIMYNALLFHSLQRNFRESALSSATMAANHLSMKLSTGVRLGKKLESYRGLPKAVEEVATLMPYESVAVLLPHGDLAFSWGASPTLPTGNALPDGIITETNGSSLVAASPIRDRNDTIKGYSVVAVSSTDLEKVLWPMLKEQMTGQALIVGLALLLVLGLLRVLPLYQAGTVNHRALRVVCMGSFVLVMLANAWLAVHTYTAYSRQSAQSSADHLGALVGKDINRLLLVGVSLGQMNNVTQYLQNIAATFDNKVVLEILNEDGTRLAGSHPAGTEILADTKRRFPLSSSTAWKNDAEKGDATLDQKQNEETLADPLAWGLEVGVASSAWLSTMMGAGLDMLTVAVVAFIFMMEAFFLFFQYLECAHNGLSLRTLDSARRSDLVRPLMFMVVLAIDMSISFIPLRMAELVQGADLFSRDVMLGLPVSVEMGMTGLSVLLAGTWMKRKGLIPPLCTGISLIALGYLGSMLALSPLQFIVARGMAGMGYGLSILAAQAYTVRHGKLSHMFAGVYAGSLCGSTMGAILADQFGYGPVFLLSFAILLFSLPWPFFLLRGDSANAATSPATGPSAPQSLNKHNLRRLLTSPQLLIFILLSLVPCAFLSIGFLNYFLPVYLNSAGVPQSDVGRVFMLYCLIFVCLGPSIGLMVHKAKRKGPLLTLGGALAALAVLCFTILPPLTASLCGALFLGFSLCLTVPAQSEYLLELDIARAIGVDQTMGLLNATERVGQVLGPLCVGAAIAAFTVPRATLWGGVSFLGIALFFLIADHVFSRRAQTQQKQA